MASLRRSASISSSIAGSEVTTVDETESHDHTLKDGYAKISESQKKTLYTLLDILKELERSSTNDHGETQDIPIKKLNHEGHPRDEGAGVFRLFHAQIQALDKELQRFANAARHLSSSAGILFSSSDLRRQLGHVSFLFRENAADLFPTKVQRLQGDKMGANQSILFRPAATTAGLTPEDMPRELETLAQDIMTFLSCLNEFPEFTDEALNGSMLSFRGDLKYWASCLEEFEGQFRYPAVARYVHDLSISMADHLHRIESSLSVFIEVGVPAIGLEQRHSSSNLANLSTIAVLFAVVTMIAVQMSLDRTGSRLYDGVNACWFTALILSVAAAVNALLGVLWQHASYRSPLHRVPWWVSIWLRQTPLVFLVASVATFSVGAILFAFASTQSLVTLIMAAVSTGLTLLGLLSILLWSALERYVYTRYAGRRWASDALFDIRASIMKTTGAQRILSAISTSTSSVLPRFNYRRAATTVPYLVSAQLDTEARTTNLPSVPRVDTQLSNWNDTVGSTTWGPTDMRAPFPSTSFGSATLPPKARFQAAVKSVIMLSRTPTSSPPIPKQQLADPKLFFSSEALVPNSPNSASLSRIASLRNALKDLHTTEYLAGHQALVRDIQFSPDGKWLATCSWDRTSAIWKVGEPFKSHRVLAHPTGFVAGVEWSPRGSLLLTRMLRTIKIWTDAGVCQRTINRHRTVNSIVWMPSGTEFLSVEDSHLTMIDLSGKLLSTHILNRLLVHDVKVTPDSKRLIGVATLTASRDGLQPTQANPEHRFFVYNLDHKLIENQVPMSFGAKGADLVISKDGRLVLVNFEQAHPQLWRIDRVNEEVRLSVNHSFVPRESTQNTRHARFGGKNDELVIAASEDGTIHIWDRHSGTLLTHIRVQDVDVTAIASNQTSDSLMLAVGSYNGNIGIWTTTTSLPTPQDKDRVSRRRKRNRSQGHRETQLDPVSETDIDSPRVSVSSTSSSPVLRPITSPDEIPPAVLDAESLLPFLTSASITANAITSLASSVKTCSQQSLELAAHCRTLVQALNAWAVQKAASGRPSVDDFDAAKKLRSDMKAVRSIISERVAEEPSAAARNWNKIVEQFDAVKATLFTPRYYHEMTNHDQERFEEARVYDTQMRTRVSEQPTEEPQFPDVPALDLEGPPSPSSEKARGRQARQLLPA